MAEDKDKEVSSGNDAGIAAAIACGAIIVGFAFYWTLQIQSVREMLALAYG